MIAVIIPTLNEEDAIESVIQGFPSSYGEHEVRTFIIDGGSTDSTVEIAKNSGAKVIHQRLKGGKGNGVSQALDEIEADIYVMIDGDGTYDPGELDRLLNPIIDGKAGHVIGWRKERSKGSIPLLNLFGNKVFNLVTRISTGEQVHDMLSGYRAFTKESLANTDITRPGFGIETEMTFTALENDVRIDEVVISYSDRKGNSKLNPITDGWRIINTLVWSIRDMSPLKFFSAASFFAVLLAVYPAFLTVQQKISTGRIINLGPTLLASVLLIVAIQLMIFGLLADQIKNVEKRLRNQR